MSAKSLSTSSQNVQSLRSLKGLDTREVLWQRGMIMMHPLIKLMKKQTHHLWQTLTLIVEKKNKIRYTQKFLVLI